MEKKHKKEIEKLSQNLQGEDQLPAKSNPQEVTAGKSEDYLKSLLVEKQQLTKAFDEEKMKHASYITVLEREVGSLQAEKNELNNLIKLMKMEKESLKKKLEETEVLLRQKDSKITTMKEDVTHFQTRLKRTEELLIQKEKEMTDLKKEVANVKTRLNEGPSAKRKDELASQTDLSDPNRPTKLGEKYLELYDYQWTDAFTNLSKRYPNASDERLSTYLYDILVDGYCFCRDVRQAQIRSLEDLILYPAGGIEASQAFVAKETMKKKYGEIMNLCALYIEECVQLCWQMQIHIPPVCIDLKSVKLDSFVADICKEYTRRGKKIAFVVWPALFLHENGPLLVKGVAQGE